MIAFWGGVGWGVGAWWRVMTWQCGDGGWGMGHLSNLAALVVASEEGHVGRVPEARRFKQRVCWNDLEQ